MMDSKNAFSQVQYYAYPQTQQTLVPTQNNFLPIQQQQYIDPNQLFIYQQPSLQIPQLFHEQIINNPTGIPLQNQLYPFLQQQTINTFTPNFLNLYAQNVTPFQASQNTIQYPQCLLRDMQHNSYPIQQSADGAQICKNTENQMIPNFSQNANSVAVNLMNSWTTAGQQYLLNGLNGKQDTGNLTNAIIQNNSSNPILTMKWNNLHQNISNNNILPLPLQLTNNPSIPQSKEKQEDDSQHGKQSFQLFKSESDVTATQSKELERPCARQSSIIQDLSFSKKPQQDSFSKEDQRTQYGGKEEIESQSKKNDPKKQEHVLQSRNFSKNLLKSFFKYALHREAEDKRFIFNFKRYIASNKTNDNMVIKLLTTSPYRAIFKDYLGEPATEWINGSKVLNISGQAQFLQMCRDEQIADIRNRTLSKKKFILSEQE